MYLTTKTNIETDWTQIAALAKEGRLAVGDEITDALIAADQAAKLMKLGESA